LATNDLPILPDHDLVLEKIKSLRKSLQTAKLEPACDAASDFLEWVQRNSTALVDDWRGQYERHGTVTPFVPNFLKGYPPGALDALSDLLIHLVQLAMAKKPGFKDKALQLSDEFLKLHGDWPIKEDVTGQEFLSCSDLANKYRVNPETLRKRLERWMPSHEESWKEVANRGPREPKYLYQVSAVLPIINDLQTSGETSG
jgi:hypothetical protein